eukprot:CAMPEP_0180214882 /NCGR_PEP_ID=MMETSP0987-20121128/15174_1 /TAXON_ID=697907 /ORGANISM="non described non described, Strain CCMP2293" /LENGTH=117 /DNA_ID=CAMNT_0022173453 /DNA_START=330 /DNA_END=684 /DNA_ORIENTATION=-
MVAALGWTIPGMGVSRTVATYSCLESGWHTLEGALPVLPLKRSISTVIRAASIASSSPATASACARSVENSTTSSRDRVPRGMRVQNLVRDAFIREEEEESVVPWLYVNVPPDLVPL